MALLLSLSLLIAAGVMGQGDGLRTSDRNVRSGKSPAVSNTTATSHNAPSDFNGDGRTDFSIVRPGPGGGTGTLTWWIRLNGQPGTHSNTQFGFNSDFIIPADFDGDGASDIAIWRPASSGSGFWVMRSSDSSVYFTPFGQPGDDPLVIADYTNDGIDDMAVFRRGDEQSVFYFIPSSGPFAGQHAAVPWGFLDDIALFGDYNGDGFADFTVVRTEGTPGRSRIYTLFGSADLSGTQFHTEQWGLPTDFYVPGDYDGDGKTDLAVTRVVFPNNLRWIIKPSGGGPIQYINWGAADTDLEVHGDYDGDGKTDVGIWRSPGVNPAPLDGYFIIRLSNGGVMWEKWGGLRVGTQIDTPTIWEFK